MQENSTEEQKQSESGVREAPNKSFKVRWAAVIVIVVVGAMTFAQFYDVVLVKKSNFPAKVDRAVDGAGLADVGSTLPANDPTLNIDVSELEVDLENLSPSDLSAVSSFLKFKKMKASIIPSGVPEIYGEELDVSFDEVQDAINKTVGFGPTYGTADKKITLTGNDLKRYIAITSQTSCEYCCGVPALINDTGDAACGCAHSVMMRGLAAYLIVNHPELSDGKILTELNRWKVSFFPKQSIAKALSQMQGEDRAEAEQILREFPDFLPQMVGGC